MDVVAFHSRDKVLVHLETSSDADSWDERRRKFQKKFQTAAKYTKSVFNFEFENVRKVAVVGLTKPKKAINFDDDVELWSIGRLMQKVIEGLIGTLSRPRLELTWVFYTQ